MDKVFVCGDTHGLQDFQKLKNFCLSKHLDSNDYVVICGDAGIVWSKDTLSEFVNAYDSLGCQILFVDGNHENFDLLSLYPKVDRFGGNVQQISKNIYHLIRGCVYIVSGKKILALGGGESSDIGLRKEHLSWWKEECISREDYINAINNLHNHNNQVDYIISHIFPYSIHSEMISELTCCGEEVPWYLEPKFMQNKSNLYLNDILNVVKFKKWYCGHFHIDLNMDKYVCLYERFYELY